MTIEDERWKTQYEQLNQRARRYSTQLWAVPFTYLGLIGIGFEKVNAMKEAYFRGVGFLVMALFSLAVFVHISSIKYYERVAVKAMRDIEKDIVSSGGSPWYMDYSFFIRVLLCILSFVFAYIGIWGLCESLVIRISLLIMSLGTLAILYLIIILRSFCRNKKIKEQIKKNADC